MRSFNLLLEAVKKNGCVSTDCKTNRCEVYNTRLTDCTGPKAGKQVSKL